MGKFQLPPEPHRGCKTWPPHTSWLFWPFWLLRLININTPTYLLSDEFLVDKKYVLSNSESVQCNFFIFDHVTFIQFKICCCVQNFMKIRWFFTEIWRYIDFQNGGRPPSWNCFTIIETTREVCCWPQLHVKFHVNLMHRSEDIGLATWIFRIFGLKCLFRPPKWVFWGTLDP